MRRRNPPTYDAAAQLELFGRNFLAFCTAQKLAGGYLAVRAIASAVYRHKVGRSLPHTIRNASFNEFEVIEVGFGSNSEVPLLARHVRCTFDFVAKAE